MPKIQPNKRLREGKVTDIRRERKRRKTREGESKEKGRGAGEAKREIRWLCCLQNHRVGKERPEGKLVSFHIQNYPEVISQPSTFYFYYLSLLKFSH